MNESYPFEERLVSYLYETFPEAKEIPGDEMMNTVLDLLKKASAYGFESEDDLAVYTVTAYLLGINFDTEFPAASHILTDPAFTAAEKADQLQTWTQEFLNTLQEDQGSEQILTDRTPVPHEASLHTYLEMQEDSAPFREKAEWVVQQLISGNTKGFIDNFSPSFRNQLGQAEVENICNSLFIPFFSGAEKLNTSATVTLTTDAFGNTGYALYLTLIQGAQETPFVIYMVSEAGRIVVANLIPNKSYQHIS